MVFYTGYEVINGIVTFKNNKYRVQPVIKSGRCTGCSLMKGPDHCELFCSKLDVDHSVILVELDPVEELIEKIKEAEDGL